MIKSGINYPNFEFKPLFLQENLILKNNTYINKGFKTHNEEKLSLDLIFIDNLAKISKVCKENSMLTINLKLDTNSVKLTSW